MEGAGDERDLSPQALRLVEEIHTVLNQAIKAGGSSLRDHRQTSGELGYFQHSFQVYDREGEKCQTPRCGGTIRRFNQAPNAVGSRSCRSFSHAAIKAA